MRTHTAFSQPDGLLGRPLPRPLPGLRAPRACELTSPCARAASLIARSAEHPLPPALPLSLLPPLQCHPHPNWALVGAARLVRGLPGLVRLQAACPMAVLQQGGMRMPTAWCRASMQPAMLSGARRQAPHAFIKQRNMIPHQPCHWCRPLLSRRIAAPALRRVHVTLGGVGLHPQPLPDGSGNDTGKLFNWHPIVSIRGYA